METCGTEFTGCDPSCAFYWQRSEPQWITEVQAELRHYRYKPGVTIHAHRADATGNTVALIIKRPVVDADAYAATGEQRVSNVVSTKVLERREWNDYHPGGPALLKLVLRLALIEMETHEVDEFLRYDGVHVTDPHADERPRATRRLEFVAHAGAGVECAACDKDIGPSTDDARYAVQRAMTHSEITHGLRRIVTHAMNNDNPMELRITLSGE